MRNTLPYSLEAGVCPCGAPFLVGKHKLQVDGEPDVQVCSTECAVYYTVLIQSVPQGVQ